MHDICKEMQNKLMTLYSKMSDSLKHEKMVTVTDSHKTKQLQLSFLDNIDCYQLPPLGIGAILAFYKNRSTLTLDKFRDCNPKMLNYNYSYSLIVIKGQIF